MSTRLGKCASQREYKPSGGEEGARLAEGAFVGTERIDRYGSYYFHLPSKPLATSGSVEISFRVDHAELNQSTRLWYTYAATFACSSAAMFSTAAVTAGSS
jgi:hypothetical protein